MTGNPPGRALTAADAFRLPPATAGRFLLLILTALVSSGYAYYWIGVAYQPDLGVSLFQCGARAYETVEAVEPAALVAAFDRCQYGVNLRIAAYLAVPGVLLAVVTAIIYLATPWWVLRRGVLPLDTMAATSAAALVREAVAASGHRVRVHVSVAPLVGLARTFGRLRHYRILLDARLLRATPQTQRTLRAVLDHELGHLANRDVDLTSMTIAVWWAFLAVVGVPSAVAVALRPADLIGLVWPMTVLIVMMWLIRVAVLRTREYYADLHVARSAPPDDLVAVLRTIPDRPVSRTPLGWLRWQLRSVHHPRIRNRIAVLHGAPRVYRLSPALGAAVGLLLGFGYPPAYYVLTLVDASSSVHVRGWLVALLFGGLVAAVVTGAVWRAVQGSVVLGEPPPRTGRFAVAFTGGVLAAQYLAPPFPLVGSWRPIVQSAPLIGVATALLLLLMTLVYLRWTVLGAWTRMRHDAGRRAYWIGVIQSAILVALWLAFWFLVNEMVVVGVPSLRSLTLVMFTIALNPALQLTILWACAYLVVVWRGPRTPLLSALVLSGVVTAGFAVAGWPVYPMLKRSLIESYVTGEQSALIGALLLLSAVAGAVAVVAGATVGWTAGGRRRTGVVLAASLLGMVIPALAAVPLVYLHVGLALCGVDSSGVDCILSSDLPEVTNGGMSMLAFAVLALGTGTAVLAGSSLRAVTDRMSSKRRQEPPARRRAVVLAMFLPVLTAMGFFAYAGTPVWFTAMFASAATPVPQAVLDRLADPGTEPVAMTQACLALVDATRTGSLSEVMDGSYGVREADVTMAARATPDLVLRSMSREAEAGLRAGDMTRASTALVTMARYCTALPPTAFQPGAYGPTPPPAVGSQPPSPSPSPSPAPPDPVVAVITDPVIFAAPSHNIICRLDPATAYDGEAARCDIVDKEWAVQTPPDCELDYGRAVQVESDGESYFLCAGDGPGGQYDFVLEYGHGLRTGAVVCTSEPSGVECYSEHSGHGFRLSRAEYDMY